MAVFGQMRYTNAVFAEDEEGLPEGWKPFATERHGFAPGTNAVSVFVSTGASNIQRRGTGRETPEEEGLQGLHRAATYLKIAHAHYVTGYEEGTPGAVIIPPVVAGQLADLGWTQTSIRAFLWENSSMTKAEVERSGLKQWIEAAPLQSVQDTANDDPWYISRHPDNIILLVAGGAHPTHNFWMQGNSRRVVGRRIELPAAWPELLKKADTELGCGDDVCLI